MNVKAAITIGIVSSAVAWQSMPPRVTPQPLARFCVSECPTPMDGRGELGKMRDTVVGMSSSSNFSAHWQFGSTAANVGPFLP